jgi:hypothetical protein
MDMSETTDSSGPLSPLLDDADAHDSSADVTSELPAADRTVTDLEALTPESAEAAADATGEIEALDILEVVSAQEAPPARAPQPPSDAVHASTIPVAPPSSRAAEVLETSRLPAVMIAGQQPSAPSIPAAPVAGAPHGYHPSSIAPLALDVTPAPRPSYASSASWHPRMPADPRESTVEIARAAGIPSRASRVVVFTASVAGMCLVAGVLGVMIGYSHGPSSKAQPQSLAAPGPATTSKTGASTGASTGAVNPAIPHTAVVTGAREEITEGPILVPTKDAASIAEGPDDGLTISPADDAPVATSAPIPTPLAVAPPAPAPAPRAAAPAAPITRSAAPARSASSSGGAAGSSNASSSTGVLRLPASVSGVLIDGVPHRAGGGGLVVTCGRHTVKAPGHPSRLVIIPCGGSAAL